MNTHTRTLSHARNYAYTVHTGMNTHTHTLSHTRTYTYTVHTGMNTRTDCTDPPPMRLTRTDCMCTISTQDVVSAYRLLQSSHCPKSDISKFCYTLDKTSGEKNTVWLRLRPEFTRLCILRELIPAVPRSVNGFEVANSVVFINNVPLQRPFSEYSRLVVGSISKALTSLCKVIHDLVGSYLVSGITQEDDTFSVTDFPSIITISLAPTSAALFASKSCTSSMFFTLSDRHTGCNPHTIMVADFIQAAAIKPPYSDGPVPVSKELASIRATRFRRTQLTVILTIGGIRVEFANAGMIGALLDQMPDMGYIFKQAISCFVWYLRENKILMKDNHVIEGVNPLLLSTACEFSRVEGINAYLHNTASVHLCGVMPRVGVVPLVPPYDLKTMVRHLVGTAVVQRVVKNKPPQQAALKTINNYWLLLRKPAPVFRRVMQAMELQAAKNTTSFSLFDLNHLDLEIGHGIVAIPYLNTLMDFSFANAIRVLGELTVAWGDFYDPSSSSDSPCLVIPRIRGDAQPQLLIPNLCCTRDFPVDDATFTSNMDISTRLRLPLMVEFDVPSFVVGWEPIDQPTPKGFSRPVPAKAGLPITNISDVTNAFMWSALVDYFHAAMTAAFDYVVGLLQRESVYPSMIESYVRFFIPQLFRYDQAFRDQKSMMSGRFYAKLNPVYEESLLSESNCSRHSTMDMKNIWSPLMESSALKQLVNLLPSCMVEAVETIGYSPHTHRKKAKKKHITVGPPHSWYPAAPQSSFCTWLSSIGSRPVIAPTASCNYNASQIVCDGSLVMRSRESPFHNCTAPIPATASRARSRPLL